MRTKICTSLGALLLFLAPLGCSDPDAPSPEQPCGAGVYRRNRIDGRTHRERNSRVLL